MATDQIELDLGNGVTLRWVYSSDSSGIDGFSICHPNPEVLPDGQCCGYCAIRGRPNAPDHPSWEFNGNYEVPTMAPSVLCGCGFHGFVRNGKWETA